MDVGMWNQIQDQKIKYVQYVIYNVCTLNLFSRAATKRP